MPESIACYFEVPMFSIRYDRSIQNSMSGYFKQWAPDLTHSSEVAKVILQAVTSDDPDFRYTVGKDAAMTLET